MRFQPATAEAVEASRSAVKSAEAIRQRECGNGDPRQRGPNCRMRETAEQEKRDALAAVLANKAATDRAAKLDTDAAAIRARLDKAHPVGSVNPLADTLGRVLSVTAETAATAQQVAMVVVVELLIAFALLGWELLAAKRAPETAPGRAGVTPTRETTAAPRARPAPRKRVPALIEAERASGDVAKFAVTYLRPVAGASLAIETLYRPYTKWCAEQGYRAVSADRFEELFSGLCNLSGFPQEHREGTAYCVGLQIAA